MWVFAAGLALAGTSDLAAAAANPGAGRAAPPAIALPVVSDAAKDIAEKLRVGEYVEAINLGERAVAATPGDEDAHLLLIRGLLQVGRNSDGFTAAQRAVDRLRDSIRIRWAAREAALASGDLRGAETMITSIRTLYNDAITTTRYADPGSRVVSSRVALVLNADPKQVLDTWLTPATRANPKLRDIYLAKGELALSKHDYNVAARAYQDGLRQIPDDPDLHHGLAVAFEPSDRKAMIGELEKALKVNPRHVPSLLMLADHEIAGEDYIGAERLLDQVRSVNPVHPDEWAYRAIIAHLRYQPELEKEAREKALASWKTNPRVDYLIGKKLAEKYRFAEAAEAQRRALAFDADFLPAKSELAVDLLRLGEETEGWKLAKEVHDADAYDVEAFNLLTLHDTLDKYTVLKTPHFQVRMPAREAEIYGPRATALLEQAYGLMTAKYGMEPAQPTFVEIFGDQKDFAVRTFGMPDVGGFLGVCFGRVLTANGPAAAVGTNWEAVLWHEFCHVITLQMTRNRMPRWLSEGISVYEEGLKDPSWGMALTPAYRQRIMEGKLSAVSEMSAAFLNPKDPDDLQFAYFQAGLVVKFLFDRHGPEKVKLILRDLGAGMEINRALAAHTSPIASLETDFTAYARAQATAIGPNLAWDAPDREMMERNNPEELGAWAQRNLDNYWALLIRIRLAVNLKNWASAKANLNRLVELYPDQTGADSAYRTLAAVHRELGEKDGERAALARLAELESDVTDAYLRLMELSQEAGDWATVAKVADRYLAVNPLVVPPYRYLAQASIQRNELPAAIAASRTMLKLDPPDLAGVHFQLAQLLNRTGDAEARRQVLLALEEAPRYRAALALLASLPPPAATPAPAVTLPNAAPPAGPMAPVPDNPAVPATK